MKFPNPEESPAEYFVLFVIMWVTICAVLSLLSGWRQLATDYRHNGSFAGTKWYFRSASFRFFVGYNGVLTIGANAEGLYLAVLLPFRIGHPPLFIPWRHVRKVKKSLLGFLAVPLHLGENDPVRMLLGRGLVRRFEELLGHELQSSD